MSSKKPHFYLTSPIFYPNANLHMGHAYTMTVCDIIARYHRDILKEETFFLTGTDENTSKVLKGSNNDEDISVALTQTIENFKKLYTSLDISYDDFIRTTDQKKHWPGAVAMWKALVEAGDIEKRKYTGLYCVGCETFYTEKDLVDGKCPIHLTVPEKVEEENYFFKLSKYTSQIKEKIESGEFNIVPESRKNEILALLDRGLEDVSFSRPQKTVPHGIPVPGDDTQVIYVWCDALVNYISALGYGQKDTALYDKFWPANVHVIGKDILRFHAAIWPAMLISAKLPLPKNLFVHGFITSGGHKMSKSLGNIISPEELIEEYGSEAVRYYLAGEISPFEDGDLTKEGFKNAYNAKLANGLGNLVSRVMKMAASNNISLSTFPVEIIKENFDLYTHAIETFNVKHGVDLIWISINHLDLTIQKTEPFKLIKTDRLKAESIIKDLLVNLFDIALRLEPILPTTSQKIIECIKANKVPEKPLFLRKN